MLRQYAPSQDRFSAATIGGKGAVLTNILIWRVPAFFPRFRAIRLMSSSRLPTPSLQMLKMVATVLPR
jgi:hypothetical protein